MRVVSRVLKAFGDEPLIWASAAPNGADGYSVDLTLHPQAKSALKAAGCLLAKDPKTPLTYRVLMPTRCRKPGDASPAERNARRKFTSVAKVS